MANRGRDDRTRSEAISELFEITKRELPMKTETPPGKLDAFVMMEVVEYALNLPAITPEMTREQVIKALAKRRDLSEFYREKHDIRMIGKSRKGRKELETVIAAQTSEDVKEFVV